MYKRVSCGIKPFLNTRSQSVFSKTNLSHQITRNNTQNRDRQNDETRLQIESLINSKQGYDSNLPYFGKDYWLRILLVRHGEAQGNVDKSIFRKMADHAIPLTEKGVEQAREAGTKIRDFFQQIDDQQRSIQQNYFPSGRILTKPHRRLWVSPYRRARETAEHIMDVAKDCITDKREHILLGEQQFGLFEGHSLSDLEKLYPQEFEHFQKCIQGEGRFWARMPLGESRFDVAKRVHQAFGTFHRDAEFHRIQDIVIVSHGSTIRAFLMMWLHHSVEWFEKEANPPHCSIRLVEDNLDKGYLFEGFKEGVSDYPWYTKKTL